jgi:hypothetical protein
MFISGLKKQPHARSAPSIPPPFRPPAKAPVEKGGQAGDVLGFRGTAKQPCALHERSSAFISGPVLMSAALAFISGPVLMSAA